MSLTSNLYISYLNKKIIRFWDKRALQVKMFNIWRNDEQGKQRRHYDCIYRDQCVIHQQKTMDYEWAGQVKSLWSFWDCASLVFWEMDLSIWEYGQWSGYWGTAKQTNKTNIVAPRRKIPYWLFLSSSSLPSV